MAKSDGLDKRARTINKRLAKAYPDAKCALNYETPLQLLIATILSAQCTDVRVNMVTPDLFKRYPDARAFAEADPDELQRLIQSTGFFRNKAKNIKACCQRIVGDFRGSVPSTMEQLIGLPGVARKTANVVLGNAFGVPGITVDTHMKRLANRMGLTAQSDPVKIEKDLCERLPAKEWTMFSHRMISHGREICGARKPLCEACPVEDLCPRVGLEVTAPDRTNTRKRRPKESSGA